TQNNSPVSGGFKSFTGKIIFDKNKLEASQVSIYVYLDSVSTTFSQVAKTLKTVEWFNAVSFPVAIFKASSFKKLMGDQYQANGTLTIRDKTVPVVLNF